MPKPLDFAKGGTSKISGAAAAVRSKAFSDNKTEWRSFKKKKKQDRMVLDMTEIPAEIISVKCFGVLLSKHMPNMHAATTDIHSRLATIHTVELGIPSIHIYYDLSLTQSQ